ncbi:MAG: colicin V synthesis protein [Sulfuricurvum sp. GWF2_44_89]|uniref:Colicin V synthesis protein n=1 Tax=Sulfuricurvum kujiense TaxID=148813 RepID=A0A2D3WBI1_9BACT|nr:MULTISPECIES: CvpA family protein [Sulfuricurvum]OHD78791.1 MAG: colicin V synthesis protein [Sulfuricurvum sp. GWF2_44_89]OHD93825.1 MAG: colicin V synthesis protein [Sulfuricurvum sp. RIFOXYD2_FULL_44_160]OHD95717.1 MAG: colicin V synthesis protein [Sulfuricurvum sp. RIFOXYD12_FULL_44_77]DAB37778.1 MAG TPA: colicin V synthesis protein [Sulfuricurvum kujiense]
MDLNYFDVAVGSVVLLLGLKGLLNGFSKEVFGLAGIVGGVFVASHLGGIIGKFLSDALFHFESTTAINLVGFIFALGIFWLLMVALGTGFKKLTTLSGLGPLDRVLGFIIGSSKFFFIISIIVYALFSVTAIRENFENKMADSFFYKPMFATGDFILHIETDDVTSLIGDDNETDTNSSKEN